MSEAINLGITKGPCGCCLSLKEFIKHLASELNWPVGKVESVLNMLSLRPRADYLAPPPPYVKHDVYPWRFNRELSYLRRPFICIEKSGGVEVMWGFRHVYACMQYLTRLIFNGRLKARTTGMRELLGEINNEDGKEFNDNVALLFERNRNLIVRRRVQKIGSQPLLGSGGSLGDIDVLVGDPATNTLSVVECKSLGGTHTPYEMWGEIQKLFHGEEGRKSILQKHQARVEWATKHLNDVLDWLKIDQRRDWKVQSMIVTDHELVTPYLRECPVRVVPIAELRKELDGR